MEAAPQTDMPSARPGGNTKVSREDWLNHAMEILIDSGVEQVKILTVSAHLGVSRSSFYWYFKNREELLQALLEKWERSNTGVIRAQAALPARTITGAICNLFLSFIGLDGFNHRLDFAIREWARRSEEVSELVHRTDQTRLAIIAGLFETHGYAPDEAVMRARILYYMQIGYYALELHEPVETRLDNVPGYLLGFTGREPDPGELATFFDKARQQAKGRSE
ncbi:TetR/AcrR family transcriptional regulator [Rhodobacteraceae bacterium NNCM2]|nr:TetR/AcrR family transcriptional regulator [Coraliihabitans acroporae]